jgi:tetratricopeptide (TPR) repeat protein
LQNLYAYCNQDILATEEEAIKQDKVSFLIESLKLIERTQGNAERVYAFWRMNIDKIDAWLIQIMPIIVPQILAVQGKERRESMTHEVSRFSYLMQDFPLGNRRINVELAITGYQICVSIFSRKDSPVNWAYIQNNLGNAYRDRIKGDRKENLELAIQAFQAALEVFTRQAFPIDWARTQSNLGNAYRDRIEGDRKTNLELAIQAYRASLEIRTQQDFPIEWARTQSNLNIAIQAYQAVIEIEIRTQQDFPAPWTRTQDNLENLYADCNQNTLATEEAGKKDKVGFLLESVQLIEQTQANAERVYAFWQMNIDKIDASLIQIMSDIGSQMFNFKFKGKKEQESTAITFAKFGELIQNFLLGNRSINLELAITSYQICASIFTRNEYPRRWATIQANFGSAYFARIEGNRKQNIELAIQAYQAALEVYTQQDFPNEWAKIQDSLQNLYAYSNQDTLATEEEAGKQDKVNFLIESLQLIRQTQGNAERVYAFWRMHIDKIDAWLIQIMPIIVPQILAVGVKKCESRSLMHWDDLAI